MCIRQQTKGTGLHSQRGQVLCRDLYVFLLCSMTTHRCCGIGARVFTYTLNSAFLVAAGGQSSAQYLKL